PPANPFQSATPSRGRRRRPRDRVRPESREILMSHDDPFTIDLFGNTGFSSGLDLGVTAFGSSFEPDDDDEPDPSSSTPAMPSLTVMRAPSTPTSAHSSNFYLADDRGLAR